MYFLITGEELQGVYHALEFLNKINSGEKIDVGENVAYGALMAAANFSSLLGEDSRSARYTEDGVLSENPVAIGSVDSVDSHEITVSPLFHQG